MVISDKINERDGKKVTAELRRCLACLCALDGIPEQHILAIAHAEVMALIANTFGRQAALDCMESARRQISVTPDGPQLATVDGKTMRTVQ